MKLIEAYYGRGYNVTADSFFTSAELAKKLLDKRTFLVSTLRRNRKEILLVCTKMDTHSSVFYSCESLNLVKYQVKPTKTVVLLSTLHKGAACQTEGKKKPESILYYNENKCGVDMLDSMCRCQRRLAAGDGHLLSSSTFWTSPVSTRGHYSKRRQVHACHGVSSCVSCQQN